MTPILPSQLRAGDVIDYTTRDGERLTGQRVLLVEARPHIGNAIVTNRNRDREGVWISDKFAARLAIRVAVSEAN